MEALDEFFPRRAFATKSYLKAQLKRRVSQVAEQETRLLVKSWTAQDFPKNVKNYLKSNDQILFQ